jgi:hypothetical protein
MKAKGGRSWMLIAVISVLFCTGAGFISMKNRQDKVQQMQSPLKSEDYLIETTAANEGYHGCRITN